MHSGAAEPDAALPTLEPMALVDLLDRVLAKGVVIKGDIVIAIANVDLVHISLSAMLASADAHTPDVVPQPAPACAQAPEPQTHVDARG